MKKRSLTLTGHQTSVSLEEEFWLALKEIARGRGKSLNALVAEIDNTRKGRNLSSAIRVFVLENSRRSRAG